MADAWPGSLPQKLETEGFSRGIGANTIRSNMEVGLDKIRKRYTKQIDPLSGTMKIDRTQYTALQTFYLVTLNAGILPFEFTDPITNTTTEYRFTSPPSFRSIGGNYFVVTLNWEVMP